MCIRDSPSTESEHCRRMRAQASGGCGQGVQGASCPACRARACGCLGPRLLVPGCGLGADELGELGSRLAPGPSLL
eukprot:3362150-Alexandrium_andersonii.AAC.1